MMGTWQRMLCVALLVAGAMSAVCTAAEKTPRKQRTASYWAELAAIYARHGDYAKAAELLRKAKAAPKEPQRNTDQAGLLTDLATFHLRHGEVEEAAGLLAKAEEGALPAASKVEVFTGMFIGLSEAGRHKEAGPYGRKAIALTAGHEAREQLFLTLLEQALEKEWKSASHLMAAAFDAATDTAEQWQLAMKLLYYHRPLQKHRDRLKLMALEIDEKTPGVLVLQAEVAMRETDGKALAMTLYEMLHHKRPKDPFVLQRLFSCCRLAGDEDKAILYGRKLIENADGPSRRHIPAVARLMVERGQQDEGLKVIRDAVKKWPKDQMILCQGARVLFDAGKVEESLKLVRRAVQLPGNYGSYAVPMLAEMLMKAGKAEEGVEALKAMRPQAMQLRMLVPRAAHLCLRHAKPEHAGEVCRSLIALARTDREKTELYMTAAKLAERHKAWDLALAMAEEILKLDEIGDSHRKAIGLIERYGREREAAKEKIPD